MVSPTTWNPQFISSQWMHPSSSDMVKRIPCAPQNPGGALWVSFRFIIIHLPHLSSPLSFLTSFQTPWYANTAIEPAGLEGFHISSSLPVSSVETWSGERSAELVSTSETRNPKPETRNRLCRLNFPRTDRNPKPETRNPKPETRNPKPNLYTFPRTRNPKPKTRNRLWRLNFPRTDRNPKPETRNPKPETRNPKPETDSADLTSPGPTETRNPKSETRNPKPETELIYLPQDPKPETQNPKPTLKT